MGEPYNQMPEGNKVIDADNMRILEFFDAKNTDQVIAKYKQMGKWDDVSVDRVGDIILWKE